LVAGQSNASSIATVILRSESDESTPAASNIEVAITRLKSELLADNDQLVVLKLLKSFLVFEILDDTAGVDHARAEEPEYQMTNEGSVQMNDILCAPVVEIITTVVMVANLFFILGSRVDDNLRNQVKEDIFEEFGREVEVGPIVAEFHNIENIT
jgi:hypothetical protein